MANAHILSISGYNDRGGSFMAPMTVSGGREDFTFGSRAHRHHRFLKHFR